MHVSQRPEYTPLSPSAKSKKKIADSRTAMHPFSLDWCSAEIDDSDGLDSWAVTSEG